MKPEDYIRAAELLETKGWIRGTYRNSDGHCLVGSMINTAGYDAWDESRSDFYDLFSPADFPMPGLATWNDEVCESSLEAQLLLLFAAEAMDD